MLGYVLNNTKSALVGFVANLQVPET